MPAGLLDADAVGGGEPDTVAFRSVFSTAPGAAASEEDAEAAGRHSHLRAYRYVDGHMGLVWLERLGDGDPSVADLPAAPSAPCTPCVSASRRSVPH